MSNVASAHDKNPLIHRSSSASISKSKRVTSWLNGHKYVLVTLLSSAHHVQRRVRHAALPVVLVTRLVSGDARQPIQSATSIHLFAQNKNILCQGRLARVVAHQGQMIASAPRDGIRDRGPAHHQPFVQDARQVPEPLELCGKGLLVRRGDAGLELEQDCTCGYLLGVELGVDGCWMGSLTDMNKHHFGLIDSTLAPAPEARQWRPRRAYKYSLTVNWDRGVAPSPGPAAAFGRGWLPASPRCKARRKQAPSPCIWMARFMFRGVTGWLKKKDKPCSVPFVIFYNACV